MPTASGRSIRLFLADGSPDGMVTADMGNWVGKVLSAPRPRVGELLRRPECARTGIYVMLGPDPERAGALVAYIGEADDLAARMRYHVSSGDQDFFERVAVTVSADDNLTKTHARYLESQLIRATQLAGSIRLTNTRAPDFRRLPEADMADMDYFLAQLRIVLPILGYDLFRPAATTSLPDRPRSAPSDPVSAASSRGVSFLIAATPGPGRWPKCRGVAIMPVGVLRRGSNMVPAGVVTH